MAGRPSSVEEVPPASDEVRALVRRHRAFAVAVTPPSATHALDEDALAAADVTVLGVRDGAGTLVAIGALRHLEGTHGELKSMHVAQEARGQGHGRRLLDALLALAVERGCTRVSLETGSFEAFAPARALYLAAGFEECPPFGGYAPSPSTTFLSRPLP